MLFKKLKGLAKFDKPLKENSLIFCPECRGRYGVRKWKREVSDEGLVCPRCRFHFSRGALFVVDYFDREVSEVGDSLPTTVQSPKVSARAGVGGTDTLIKGKG